MKKMNIRVEQKIFLKVIVILCLIICGCTSANIFSSIEDAYQHQYHEQKANINLIIDGKDTALVVGKGADGVDYYNAYLKVNNGWRYTPAIMLKEVKSSYTKVAMIILFQYKNTDDYYIQIMSNSENIIEIVDNRKTKFELSENGQKYKTYYGYLSSWDKGYELYIEGEKIRLQ